MLEQKKFKIRLLTHNIRVHNVGREMLESQLMGRANLAEQLIEINKHMAKDAKAQTFLHEAIHLIDRMLSLGLTEQQVDGVSAGVLSLLRENKSVSRDLADLWR